jgi:hypothetical protein
VGTDPIYSLGYNFPKTTYPGGFQWPSRLNMIRKGSDIRHCHKIVLICKDVNFDRVEASKTRLQPSLISPNAAAAIVKYVLRDSFMVIVCASALRAFAWVSAETPAAFSCMSRFPSVESSELMIGRGY